MNGVTMRFAYTKKIAHRLCKKGVTGMRWYVLHPGAGRLAAVCLGLCVLFGAVCVGNRYSPVGEAASGGAALSAVGRNEVDADTPEGRAAFFGQFGIAIEEPPVVVKEVTIPITFDAVYERYNDEIQRPAGYDLRRYAGRTVTLYACRVVDHPSGEDVTANLLVLDGRVIGGDLCSSRLDGFMTGLGGE